MSKKGKEKIENDADDDLKKLLEKMTLEESQEKEAPLLRTKIEEKKKKKSEDDKQKKAQEENSEESNEDTEDARRKKILDGLPDIWGRSFRELDGFDLKNNAGERKKRVLIFLRSHPAKGSDNNSFVKGDGKWVKSVRNVLALFPESFKKDNYIVLVDGFPMLEDAVHFPKDKTGHWQQGKFAKMLLKHEKTDAFPWELTEKEKSDVRGWKKKVQAKTGNHSMISGFTLDENKIMFWKFAHKFFVARVIDWMKRLVEVYSPDSIFVFCIATGLPFIFAGFDTANSFFPFSAFSRQEYALQQKKIRSVYDIGERGYTRLKFIDVDVYITRHPNFRSKTQGNGVPKEFKELLEKGEEENIEPKDEHITEDTLLFSLRKSLLTEGYTRSGNEVMEVKDN